MKALCIVGSPKEQGNTSFVVDKIISGMESSGIETTKYVLGKLNINYCLGCKSCSRTRHCVQRDDMDIIFENILKSDIILVAAPSYWGDVPGQLKVFIDRCLPLCNAEAGDTPVPNGKIGISVALRAGKSKKENQHLIDTIEHFFGHLDIKPVEKLTIEGLSKFEDFDNNLEKLEEAYNLGKSIIKYNH